MNELYELKEKLKKELGEYSQNGKYSKEDSEVMKNLSGTIDHICNIIEKAEAEGYSGNYPYWMGGAYADGNGDTMGGNMGGKVDESQLPAIYEIDYVRVFQKP